MQRNLLFLQQQQALVRQAQQQKAAASAALANNGQVPDQLNLWMQQQQQQQPGGAFNPSIDAKPWLPQQQQTLQQSLPLQQQPIQQQPQPQPQQQQHHHQQQQAVPKTVGMMQRKSQPVLSTQSLPFDTVHVETVRHKKNLKTYMDRDNRYQVTLDRQHKRHVELAQQKKQEIDLANQTRRERAQHKGMSTFGLGYNGYGNGKTGPPTPYTRITYPGEKKRKRQQIRIPLQHCIEQAKKEELLVPIRLDIDQDGYRVRDTFTWNLNESLISPEQFAEITCDDLRLPVPVFGPLIAASIKEQIQDFDLNMSSMVVQEDSKVDAYQEFIRSKKQKTDKEEEEEKVVEKKPVTELRTIIKLDIIVGHRILNDQFEWDITCQHNSPEMFAEKMVTDLGLGGEFKTAIAHSIREQVHVYIKSLLLTGHDFSDNLVENDELRRSFLPTVRNVIREGQYLERFTPSLLELTESEMDKIEKGRIRESRRKRRGVRNRKGVVSLPDRDPIPTFRTIFASPPEHEMTDDQFLKSMQINNSIEAHHSQRKSAAKARMNIAAEAAGVSLTSGQLEDHVDQITRPVSNKLVHPSWRCVDCGCSPFMTSIVRSSNQTGEKSLCNACGLYRYKYNSVRPRNYVEKDMVNEIPHMNDWQNHLTKYR